MTSSDRPPATTDLCDAHPGVQVAEPVLRHFGGRARFAGQVATVLCIEDNSKVREAVGEPGRGRVLVVDGGASSQCALLGDLLGEKAGRESSSTAAYAIRPASGSSSSACWRWRPTPGAARNGATATVTCR
jgi:regulator of RNase E activity RraA